MSLQLYATDSYVKEFDAKVAAIVEDAVTLDKTAFYPGGGGQPHDTGTLTFGGVSAEVTEVFKLEDGTILHRLKGSVPPIGSAVHGSLNWELRYSYMRHHSAIHVVSGVALKLFGAHITGGQIYPDKARVDLGGEGFDKSRVAELEQGANEVVNQNRRILVKFVSREEAAVNPHLMRVNPKLYPAGDRMRVIEIEGFDSQFDGGTHVAATGEVGPIRIVKFENKGKANKRIEIVLGGTRT
ncbi:MAG: alanyl-tRNA editing protein [Thermoprotei archaeon]